MYSKGTQKKEKIKMTEYQEYYNELKEKYIARYIQIFESTREMAIDMLDGENITSEEKIEWRLQNDCAMCGVEYF